jgi:hypothetical protein
MYGMEYFIVTSKYLQSLITLQSSVISIVKSEGTKQLPVGHPNNLKKKMSKMHTENCRLESKYENSFSNRQKTEV